MKEPRLSIRYNSEELALYKKLAELMGAKDISSALRLLAREKLEALGVEVPDEYLSERVEGRPRRNALTEAAPEPDGNQSQRAIHPGKLHTRGLPDTRSCY